MARDGRAIKGRLRVDRYALIWNKTFPLIRRRFPDRLGRLNNIDTYH